MLRALSSSWSKAETSPRSSGQRPDHHLLAGLKSRPLSIPCKYFYDDRGSELFDAITELPEYYPTRTEQALLDSVSDDIAALAPVRHLLELGAGTARKTRSLIRALLDVGGPLRYTPLDISKYALEQAEASLSREFPALEIQGIQCDYTRSLGAVDPEPDSLTLFLGSTIGNFTHERAVALLSRLRSRLHQGDRILLGVDLVKPTEVLEAAYNDSRGVTAEFNRNILNAVNREAGGDFDAGEFDHLAFFDEERSQIEMYLVARKAVRVRLEHFGLALEIAPGERILTEISRKFTRASAHRLLSEADFELAHWFTPENEYFALALARAADSAHQPIGPSPAIHP